MIKGYEEGDEVALAGAVLEGEVTGKVVGEEVGVAALDRGADGTDYLDAGVGVFGADLLGEGDVGESHLVAVGTGEALRLFGAEHLAAVVELKVGAREDALHGMLGQVARTRGVVLVAGGAEVVVVADEAFEAAAAEVALQARIAADPW